MGDTHAQVPRARFKALVGPGSYSVGVKCSKEVAAAILAKLPASQCGGPLASAHWLWHHGSAGRAWSPSAQEATAAGGQGGLLHLSQG